MNTCQIEENDPADGTVFVCDFKSKHLTMNYRVAPRIVDAEESDDRLIELSVGYYQKVGNDPTEFGGAAPVLTVDAARKLATRLIELADLAEAAR